VDEVLGGPSSMLMKLSKPRRPPHDLSGGGQIVLNLTAPSTKATDLRQLGSKKGTSRSGHKLGYPATFRAGRAVGFKGSIVEAAIQFDNGTSEETHGAFRNSRLCQWLLL